MPPTSCESPDLAQSRLPSKPRKYPLSTLLAPTATQLGPHFLEYSIHCPPAHFQRDLSFVFPALTKADLKSLLVIPTIQKCHNDMVSWGAVVDKERDAKLEIFVSWGKAVAGKLREMGFWADVMDPASGFPIFSDRGNAMYPDVQGTQALLRYDVQNTGCCNVLLHPLWGSKIYPSTMFTTAGVEVAIKAVAMVEDESKAVIREESD